MLFHWSTRTARCFPLLTIFRSSPKNNPGAYWSNQKGNFGYPWEGTLAVVPPILPHIALYNHYIIHILFFLLVYISGTLPRVPNFSLWSNQTMHLSNVPSSTAGNKIHVNGRFPLTKPAWFRKLVDHGLSSPERNGWNSTINLYFWLIYIHKHFTSPNFSE